MPISSPESGEMPSARTLGKSLQYERHQRPGLGHTVFGEIFRGMEVVDKIVATARDHCDNPLQPMTMTMTVEQ